MLIKAQVNRNRDEDDDDADADDDDDDDDDKNNHDYYEEEEPGVNRFWNDTETVPNLIIKSFQHLLF